MMNIIYYGELDPYSGSIRSHPNDFPRLLNELKLILLFSDRVILPTENMIHHPLSLPAFEALRPFVKAGLLGTSTNRPHEARTSFLQRIDVTADQMFLTNTKHFKSVRARWKSLLPDSWGLKRIVKTQKQGCLSIISRLLLDDYITRDAETIGREFIAQIKNYNDLPNRTNLMELVASNTGLMGQPELYHIQLAIQSSYFRMGSVQKLNLENKSMKIKHFSGGFYKNHISFIKRLPRSVALDYADELDPVFVNAWLSRTVGVSLASILSLPVDELYHLRALHEWSEIRSLFMQREAPEQALRLQSFAEFKKNGLLEGVKEKRHGNDFTSIPDPIQNTIRGRMGWNISINDPYENAIIYNSETGKLTYFNDTEIILPPRLTPYMNLLSDRGRTGIMPIEFDLLETIKISRAGQVRPRFIRYFLMDQSDKINAKKKRSDLRKILEPTGLSIIRKKGAWFLDGPEIHVVGLTMAKVFSFKYTPVLPPQQMTLFTIIAEAQGQRVSLGYLEQSLNKEGYNVTGQYRMSKLISFLNNLLTQQQAPYRVVSRQRGYVTLSQL